MTCSRSSSSSSSTPSSSDCTHSLRHSDASWISNSTSPSWSKPWYKAAAEAFELAMKTKMNTVSFIGKKELSSANNSVVAGIEQDKKQLEVELDPKLYCKHCNQLHTYYHRHVFIDLIAKKIFFMYSNKTNEIKKQMRIAYNEHCRSKFENTMTDSNSMMEQN